MGNEAALGIRLFLVDSASGGMRSFGSTVLGMMYAARGLNGAFGGAGTSAKSLEQALAQNVTALAQNDAAFASTALKAHDLYNAYTNLAAGGPVFTAAQDASMVRMQTQMTDLGVEETSLQAKLVAAQAAGPLFTTAQLGSITQYQENLSRLNVEEQALSVEQARLSTLTGTPLFSPLQQVSLDEMRVKLVAVQDEEAALVVLQQELIDKMVQAGAVGNMGLFNGYAAQVESVGFKIDALALKEQQLTARIAATVQEGIDRQTAALDTNQASIDRVNNRIDDTIARLDVLKQQGWDANTTAIDKCTAAIAANADAQVDLQAKMDALTAQGVSAQSAQMVKLSDAYDALIAKEGELTTEQVDLTATNVALKDSLNNVEVAGRVAAVSMGLLVAGAVGVVGFGSALLYGTKQAADFEESMSAVQIAVQGAVGPALDALRARIVSLADQSKFSTKEMADAFALMGEHGYTAANILDHDMGKAATNLAEAIGSKLSPATDLLANTMQAFKLKADQATTASDILTTTFYNGIPDATQLGDELQQVAAQADSAGWSLKDTATALDVMAQDGLRGTQASTSLRYMIASLLDPTNKIQDALAALHVVTINTNSAFDTFRNSLADSGKAGLAAADGYDGSLKSLQQMYTAANKIPGLHIDESFYAWATQNGILNDKLFDSTGKFKNFSGVVNTLGTAMDNLKPGAEFNAFIGDLGGARSGKAFQLMLTNLGMTNQQIADLMVKFNQSGTAQKEAATRTDNYNSAMQRLATTFGSAAAATGVNFLTPLKNLADTLNGFFALIASNSQNAHLASQFIEVGLAVSGLLLVLGGGGLLVSGFMKAMGPLAAIDKLLGGPFKATSEIIGNVFGNMKLLGQAVGGLFDAGMQTLADKFRDFASFLRGIDWQAAFHSLYMSIGKVATSMGTSLVNGAKSAIAGIKSAFTAIPGIFKTVMDAAKIAGGKIVDAFKAIPGALNTMVGFFKTAAGNILDAFKAVPGMISGLMTKLSAVGPAVIDAMSKIPGLALTAGRAIGNLAIDFGNTFMDAIEGAGRAALSFGKYLLTIDYGAIASSMGKWLMELPAMLAGIAAQTAAWTADAIAMALANWEIVLVVVAVLALIGAFIWLFTQFHSVSGALNGLKVIFGPFVSLLRDQFIAGWKQVVSTFQSQVHPAMVQLQQAFVQMQPVLKVVGIILMGLAGVVLLTLAGALSGIIQGIMMFIRALAMILAGVVSVIAGIITFFTGFFTLLHGLFTGNGKEIQAGFHQMLDGIVGIFRGLGQIVLGVLMGTFGVILAFLKGFVMGAVGLFMQLTHGAQDQAQQMRLQQEAAHLAMEQSALKHSINQKVVVLQHMAEEAKGIEEQLKNCKNASERHRLEMKLKAIQLSEQKTLAVIHQEEVERVQLAEKQAKIKAEQDFANRSLWQKVTDAWNGGVKNVMSTLGSWLNNIRTFFTSTLPTTISGALNNIISSMSSFGANMMQNFISGILGGLGGLRGALGNVTGMISNLLGHHSPAKEGPLSDDDRWMGNMMDMHVKGILQGVPQVHRAMLTVAGAMAIPTNGSMTSPLIRAISGQPNTSSSHNAAHGNVTIPINIDGKQVASAMYNVVTGDLQMCGMSRAMR